MPLQIDPGEFYVKDLPEQPAQGDIFLNVPFFYFPEGILTLLRSQEGLSFLDPPTGTVTLVSQDENSFEHNVEYAAIRVELGAVAIQTPTCDLDAELWQVAPVLEFVPEDKLKGLVFGGHKQDRFPVVAHPENHYGDAYIDLADLRTLPQQLVTSGKRVATLNSDYQRELAEFAAKLFGRFWGMNPDEGDIAPEDGLYRCIRDSYHHTLQPGEIPPVQLKKGEPFPRCPNCDRIRKGAQYILLTKHKRY